MSCVVQMAVSVALGKRMTSLIDTTVMKATSIGLDVALGIVRQASILSL